MTKETYLKSVDKLLDAYLNNNLFHGFCQQCAVGNLLSHGQWHADFVTMDGGEQQVNPFRIENYCPTDAPYIEYGFTRSELMKIEHAFEFVLHNSKEGYNYWIEECNKKQGQYMGLVAVLDVMKDMVDVEVDYKASQEQLDTIAVGFNVLV